MGKADIISGGTGGQYSVRIKLDRSRVDGELAYWATRIPDMVTTIDGMDDGPEKDAAILQKVSAEKRVQYLNNNIEDDPVVSAWCADLTENIVSGYVGTIEVPGERFDVPVIIQPGYQGAAEYDQTRDGQLQPALAGTSSGVIYNLCMMPGWQKWKPTYRLGEITVKAGDTCSVAIDPAIFSDRGSGLSPNLNVNQDTVDGLVTLDNIPIEYMSCDGLPFGVGDRVVVKFTDQDWQQPVVIGYEDHPQPCAVGVLVIQMDGELFDEGGLATLGIVVGDKSIMLWNTSTDAPLRVPKTGGGIWDYPLTEEEYNGDFHDDLVILLGGSVGDTTNPLVDSENVETTMRINSPAYSDSASGGSNNGDQHHLYDWGFGGGEAGILHTVFYDAEEGQEAALVRLENYIEAHRTSNTIQSFSEVNQTAENNAGIIDTWSESQDRLSVGDNQLQTFEWFGEEGQGGSGYINGYLYPLGTWKGSNSDGTESIAFNAPNSGLLDDSFFPGCDISSGVGTRSNKLPLPVAVDAKILSVRNSSEADDVVAGGAEIDYSGEVIYSDSFDLDYTKLERINRVVTTVADVEASGAGTVSMTTSGQDYSISMAYHESCPAMTRTLSDTVDEMSEYIWFPSYEASRSVNYVASGLDVSSYYDTVDNIQTIIIIETELSGSGATTLTVPDYPSESSLASTETDPVYTNTTLNYNVRAINDLVPDAAADNPWDLPNNTGLETELVSMINSYLIDNPPVPGGIWKLRTNLSKLVW